MKRIILLFALVLNFSVQGQCWKTVSPGGYYNVALKSDGTLWEWGELLQEGGAGYVNYPVQLGIDNDWKSIYTGIVSGFGIKNDGTLWGWRTRNSFDFSVPVVPTQITTATNWKTVSAGVRHQLAIKSDGTLWAWGYTNEYGELGNGTTVINNMPQQIGNATDWKWVAAGYFYSFAIKTDGTLWAWGRNTYGHLGIPQSPNQTIFTVPTQVGIDTNWEKVYSKMSHSYGMKTDGSIWAWGSNNYGQFGNGTLIDSNIPIQIGTDTDWKYISLGHFSTYFMKNNGTIFACGYNNAGELANGTNINTNTITQIGIGTNWKDISAGGNFITATKIDNTLVAAGMNQNGVLGNGTLANSNVFVPVITTCNVPLAANNDTGTSLNGIATTVVANVLANDTYNSLPATTANVNLTFVSATHAGITLNSTTGAVNVSASVPAGSYTLVYQICDAGNSLNCRTANVTITVNAQTIDAVNDNFSATPISYLTGGSTPSVLSNDKLNNIAVNSQQVVITLVNNGGISGATISNLGIISIPGNTPIETYTLSYKICSIAAPELCDIANVKIAVADRGIISPDIVYGIRANSRVIQAALQSDGKIIISGAFTKYNTTEVSKLARLNADLTLDTSFLATGPAPAEQPAYEIAVQPDNKILMVGKFESFNGSQSGRGIARLNADGTPDLTFNANGSGFIANEVPRCVALQADGKILIGGGWISSYNGTPIENMIRLNTDGSLDTTFSFPYTYQINNNAGILKILVQPDGKILVSGHFGNAQRYTVPGSETPIRFPGQPSLFRLNSDGSVDTSFISRNMAATDIYTLCNSCVAPIQNLLLQPNGKIIVVGTFSNYGDYEKKNIFRLNPDGSNDSSFSVGSSSNRVIKDVILEPSGKLIIGGEFTKFNGVTQLKLARLNTNGSLDTDFSPGTSITHNSLQTGSTPSVEDLYRQVDGKVIVSGYFTHYNNISATNITRIAPEVPGAQARIGSQNYISEKEIDSNVLFANGIKIYPNPSEGIFTFDLTGSSQKFDTIAIFNALGQLIYQNSITAQAVNEIDLSKIQGGTYFAQLSGESTSIQKVLIKK